MGLAMMKRNEGLHTNEAEIQKNILAHLVEHNYNSIDRLAAKSMIGYAAYPGYSFKSPQGAAFSVARIVRRLTDEGLLHYHSRRFPFLKQGYYVSPKGLRWLASVSIEDGRRRALDELAELSQSLGGYD